MMDKTNIYDFYECREKLQREKLKKAVKTLDEETCKTYSELSKVFEEFKRKHSKSFNSELTIRGDII